MLRAFAKALQAIVRRPRRRVLLSETPAVPVDDALRTTLDERYLMLRAAMASDHRPILLALLTDDFVSEDLDGNRMDAVGMADTVAALKIDRSKRRAQTTLTSIESDGREARVLQRYEMTTTERALGLPEALWTESRDVWRLVEGRWLLASTTTIALERVSNGQRMFRRRLEPADGSVSVQLHGPVR